MTWPESAYGSAALLAACGAPWAVLRAGVDIYAVHLYAARYAVPMPRGEELEPAVGAEYATDDDAADDDDDGRPSLGFSAGKKTGAGP